MPVLLELADLGTILVLFGALIFIYLAVYIAKALFGVAGGTLGRLPIIGGWIDSSLHSVEHKIVSWMAQAATGVDDAIGWSLHQQARLVDWVGREIRAHSNLLYTLAALALGPGFAHAVRYEVAAIRRLLHATFGAQSLTLGRLLRLEHTIERGIGHDVLPRVRSLEREYTHVVGRDIAALRRRTRELEDGALDTFKWIRTHPLSLATGAFVGAVAYALHRLGGSWIKCRNWNRIGKHVCGLPLGLIDDLLSTAIVAFAATDICDFANAAETLAEQMKPALLALVDVEDALVGCHGATKPPALPLPALRLPANSRGLQLAA